MYEVRVTSGLIIHHQLAKLKCLNMSLAQGVTWRNVGYAGTQVIQWGILNKGRSSLTSVNCFVFNDVLRNMQPAWLILYHVTGLCKRPISFDSRQLLLA